MRVLLTCRPFVGHYRPMLPLARALAEAGHEVAFASGDPIAGEAGCGRFQSVSHRAGDGYRRTSSASGATDRRDTSSFAGPSPFVFAELFVGVELGPRLNGLFTVVEQWRPHVVVHDVAEFAAPLVATRAGIPYVEHSYGPAVQNASSGPPATPLRPSGHRTA